MPRLYRPLRSHGYTETLGCTVKMLTRYRVYENRPDRPLFQKIAQEDPKRIFRVYFEIAPGQFIELFPKNEGQKEREDWNSRLGYSHFALLTKDIHKTRAEHAEKGLLPDTEPSKGPSETWQMWYHDPDGNKFEVMQYTDQSYQVVGHIDE